MAVRCICLLFFQDAMGHLHSAATESLKLRASLEGADKPGRAGISLAERENEVLSRWGEVRSTALRLGMFEAPLLTNMLQRRERQEPSPATGGAAMFGGFVMQLIIATLFALLYVRYRKVPEGAYKVSPAQEHCEGHWRHECWTCYEEPGTCLCALCCLPLRWAETNSFMKGQLSLWTAFFIMALLVYLQGFVFIIFIVVGVFYRQSLRRKFNFDSQGGCSYFTDCCMYSCCAVCAIIQEARHVEDALAANHKQTECPPGRQRSSARSKCWTSSMFQEGDEYREYNWSATI